MARILIIDDLQEMRATIRDFLVGSKFESVEASNGAAALKLIEVGAPDLIVTDILMPEMEGIETIREVRRNHPRIKIIAMSGGRSAEMDFLDVAQKLGADRVLAKPFSQGQLLDLVQELLAPA